MSTLYNSYQMMTDIPDLEVNHSGNHQIESYFVVENTTLNWREIIQVDKKCKFVIVQTQNPGSIVFDRLTFF